MLWQDEGGQIEEGATELRQTHPESSRRVVVRCRNGEQEEFLTFTTSVRLN